MTELNVDQRGFIEAGAITCSYGTEVRVKESSAAMSPHIWIFLKEDPKILTMQEPGKASAHLTLEQAKQLRDSLDDLIKVHRLVDKDCDRCEDGLVWDPRVDGNVIPCPECNE